VQADPSWSPTEKAFLKRLLEDVSVESVNLTPHKRTHITTTKQNLFSQENITEPSSADCTPAGPKRRRIDGLQVTKEQCNALPSPVAGDTAQLSAAMPTTNAQDTLHESRKSIAELRNAILVRERERSELLQRDRELLEEIDRLQMQKLMLRQQLHQYLQRSELDLNALRQQYERALVEYRLKLESLLFKEK